MKLGKSLVDGLTGLDKYYALCLQSEAIRLAKETDKEMLGGDMAKFKVGDRVKVINTIFQQEKYRSAVGSEGTIVSVVDANPANPNFYLAEYPELLK